MFEINLVPDVKAKLIQAQKKRNFVFFGCFVVSAIAIAIVVVLGIVRTGQEVKIKLQDNTLELMSGKLEEYSALDEILTIQKQLADIEGLTKEKKVLSRVFTVLASILPQGTDTVTISSMSVDTGEAMMSLEGQANAGAGTDGIDYRVLEAFKKQVGLTKYDYGRYVDSEGNEIPTMCISETDSLGVPYSELDENKRELLYGVWAKGVRGCDPSEGSEEVVDEDEVEEAINESEQQGESEEGTEEQGDEGGSSQTIETVKIYRTPRFDEWYKEEYLTESGEISGVPHFESQCIQYTGVDNGDSIKWVSTNDCDLSPDGIEIDESNNGRQEGGDLVLKFSGRIFLDPEVLNYNNKHMIAIAPSGRVNVTDSLLQVESIFSERAADCEAGDTSCTAGK